MATLTVNVVHVLPIVEHVSTMVIRVSATWTKLDFNLNFSFFNMVSRS